MKKTFAKALDAMVKSAVKNSANSTTSGTMYQPKAPASLEKFSKVK